MEETRVKIKLHQLPWQDRPCFPQPLQANASAAPEHKAAAHPDFPVRYPPITLRVTGDVVTSTGAAKEDIGVVEA